MCTKTRKGPIRDVGLGQKVKVGMWALRISRNACGYRAWKAEAEGQSKAVIVANETNQLQKKFDSLKPAVKLLELLKYLFIFYIKLIIIERVFLSW